MDKKRRLIHSGCCSIIAIAILLFSYYYYSYAWFTDNAKANVGSVKISVKGEEIESITLKRYKAIHNSKDHSYTIGDLINVDSLPTPYNDLGSYDKVIYEFDFSVTSHINSISISISLDDQSRSDNFILDEDKYYNYLSNVALFKKLELVDSSLMENGEAVGLEYYNLEESSVVSSIGTFDFEDKIYLLFDYNPDNINRLYSKNIGIDLDVLYFYEDIVFNFS